MRDGQGRRCTAQPSDPSRGRHALFRIPKRCWDYVVSLYNLLIYVFAEALVRSMNDVDGPAVATVIYEALFRSNGALLDIDVVPYALDRAVRTLKSQGLSASRWAPYVHVGV